MAKKKSIQSYTHETYHEKQMFCIGIGLLIAAVMMYLGYSWMHIFGVLGILAILKGIYYMKK